MRSHRLLPSRFERVTLVVAIAAVLGLGAAPAGAQYGGGANLFVDPVQVPIDEDFDYLGSGCPAGSTVEITIVGFPDILDSTVAADDSGYLGFGVALPAGVVAGTEYRVEANCAGVTNWALITAVCSGGELPVDGECPGGGTTLGTGNPTTTTTLPGSGGSGGTTGTTGGGTNSDLAVTGLSFAEQAAQLGATLIGLGAILLLVTRRRRDEAPATTAAS